jgi:HK97 gp10 family phage protein
MSSKRIVIESNLTGEAAKKLKAGIRAIIRNATFAVEGHAKVATPVDTGNLKNSINSTIEADGERGIVATGVEYAAYVEYGTSRMAAQPYLLPAYNKVLPKVKAELDQLKASLP